MRNIFLILTVVLACVYGCYVETDSDKSGPLFTAPVEVNPPNIKDSESTPIPSTVAPDPAINNETAQQGNKDLTGPKLLESTIDSGRVDPNTDVISLRFNENIIEIDIKLVDNSDVSLGWIPSIDTIIGRRIFLNRMNGNGRRLVSDRRYSIKGFVEDKHGNKTSIDIEFRAVKENRDRTPPALLTHSINHEARNVNINTDQFVFTFNEKIAGAEARLMRGDWQAGTNMKWTRFIDEKTVVLLKTTGKSFSLRNNETYTVVLSVRDASGNTSPGNNTVWIFRFTTQR